MNRGRYRRIFSITVFATALSAGFITGLTLISRAHGQPGAPAAAPAASAPAPAPAPAAPAAPGATAVPPSANGTAPNPPATPIPSPSPSLGSGLDALTFSPDDLTRLRDPFQRPALYGDGSPSQLARSELEQYATDGFKLLAVMTGSSRLRALVQSPDGRSHTVSEGTRIGMKNGTVKRITARGVIVSEKVLNPVGKLESIDIEIKFPPKTKVSTNGPGVTGNGQ